MELLSTPEGRCAAACYEPSRAAAVPYTPRNSHRRPLSAIPCLPAEEPSHCLLGGRYCASVKDHQGRLPLHNAARRLVHTRAQSPTVRGCARS